MGMRECGLNWESELHLFVVVTRACKRSKLIVVSFETYAIYMEQIKMFSTCIVNGKQLNSLRLFNIGFKAQNWD